MKSKSKNFLKLVWDQTSNKSKFREDNNKCNPSLQIEMFSGGNNSILIIYFSDIDGKLFSNAIRSVNPDYILDMRPNPRFDIVGYSRKLAFSEFDSLGSIYMDYIKLVGTRNKNKEQLIDAAEKIFNNKKQGSIVFLFGKKEQDEIYEEELLHNLSIDKHNWSLHVVP